MFKSLAALIIVSALLSQTSHAYMTSCGGRLPNGEEIMFDLPTFDGNQTILLNVGKPHAFRAANVFVKKSKISGGLFEKRLSLKDGTRFEMTFTKTLTDARDFRLTANIPEIDFKVVAAKIDCASYY